MGRLKIALVFGLSLALLGCNAEPKRADEAGRVLLESSMTRHNVKVARQESDRIEGGLLRVRTLLDNKEKENVWVDIQVVWKDATGFKVYETNWAPLMLPARYVSTHEIVSMRADVADYEYRIRGGSKTVKPFGKQ
ncbi:MAG: hypothetical protein NTX87_08825 [Planctomycetota bacterium]|nr:hypothetical protein [Planctomycetota bacterium]